MKFAILLKAFFVFIIFFVLTVVKKSHYQGNVGLLSWEYNKVRLYGLVEMEVCLAARDLFLAGW